MESESKLLEYAYEIKEAIISLDETKCNSKNEEQVKEYEVFVKSTLKHIYELFVKILVRDGILCVDEESLGILEEAGIEFSLYNTDNSIYANTTIEDHVCMVGVDLKEMAKGNTDSEYYEDLTCFVNPGNPMEGKDSRIIDMDLKPKSDYEYQ